MLAHNELGTLQPVAEVARACRERGAPLCDAVQAVGKVAVDVHELGADYLTLGAHKLYGPLGAAALWVHSQAERHLAGFAEKEEHEHSGRRQQPGRHPERAAPP